MPSVILEFVGVPGSRTPRRMRFLLGHDSQALHKLAEEGMMGDIRQLLLAIIAIEQVCVIPALPCQRFLKQQMLLSEIMFA